jgi:hypothetical protein
MTVPRSVLKGVLTRPSIRAARVVRVDEDACEIWRRGAVTSAVFAPMFPSPRTERVSPGHLVAVATWPDAHDAVVWRWFDAVVLGAEPDGQVRLWEPAHGEFVARPRPSYVRQDPGSRAYVSAGLPRAEWWVADCADGAPPETAEVELDEVHALYAANDLWSAVFASPMS